MLQATRRECPHILHFRGGADESFFTIDASSGALTFKTAPDFETLADADKDGLTLLSQVTDDGAGSLSDTQSSFVTINNINEAPVPISHSGNAEAALSLKEGSTAVSEVMAIGLDDDNPSSYCLLGVDQALFRGTLQATIFCKMRLSTKSYRRQRGQHL